MIDLLKEQVYHGNMVKSITTDDLDSSELDDSALDNCSLTMVTSMTSQDAILAQLSMLQQQMASQRQQSQLLSYSISEVGRSLFF